MQKHNNTSTSIINVIVIITQACGMVCIMLYIYRKTIQHIGRFFFTQIFKKK